MTHTNTRPTPLSAIYAFSWLNSFSTGAATTGIFFITDSTYAFSADQNYALGLLMGVTYVMASTMAGRILRRLQALDAAVTQRRILAGLVVALGLILLLPVGARAAGVRGSWPIWLTIGLYSPLTGILWPMVESYLSGGRSGERLRDAIGRFNIVWGSSLVLAFWVMGPLRAHAMWTLSLMALLHGVGALFLLRFEPEPAQHIEGQREPHPPVYLRPLVVHRILLSTGYLVMFALSPYLPTICARLSLGAAWYAPLASVWLLARVATFAWFARWHGWHGRWETPVVAAMVMLSGFAAAVLAPSMTTGWIAMVWVIVGLSGFGAGVAAIYKAALYYVMEVGDSGIDAGGSHEALIGIGYTVGPLCGLVAGGLVSQGWIPVAAREPCMLAAVGVMSGLALGYAMHRASRSGGAGH